MKGEKGFIYPVTMLVCLLVIPIVLHQINLYMKEKQFIYEQERLLQLETLLQVGIDQFQRNEIEPQINEKITYSYGLDLVTFTIKDYKEGVSFISVKAQLETGHERIAGFHYNWSDSTVSHYWEVSDSLSFISGGNVQILAPNNLMT